jgi:hypothetical protein
MPDFQPTSKVTHLTSPSDQTFFTTNHDLGLSLQNTVPAPRARIIAYNAVYPVSALGFKSPTLAQLMARYATMDPILSSISADKRKGLSLIAPLAAKRKRTSKKVPVEVRFPLSCSQDYSYSDNFHLVQFQARNQQPSASEPANAPSIGMTFTTSLFLKDQYLH